MQAGLWLFLFRVTLYVHPRFMFFTSSRSQQATFVPVKMSISESPGLIFE